MARATHAAIIALVGSAVALWPARAAGPPNGPGPVEGYGSLPWGRRALDALAPPAPEVGDVGRAAGALVLDGPAGPLRVAPGTFLVVQEVAADRIYAVGFSDPGRLGGWVQAGDLDLDRGESAVIDGVRFAPARVDAAWLAEISALDRRLDWGGIDRAAVRVLRAIERREGVATDTRLCLLDGRLVQVVRDYDFGPALDAARAGSRAVIDELVSRYGPPACRLDGGRAVYSWETAAGVLVLPARGAADGPVEVRRLCAAASGFPALRAESADRRRRELAAGVEASLR